MKYFLIGLFLCLYFYPLSAQEKGKLFDETLVFSLQGFTTISRTDYITSGVGPGGVGSLEYFFPSSNKLKLGAKLYGGSLRIKGTDFNKDPDEFRTDMFRLGLGVSLLVSIADIVYPELYGGVSYLNFDPKDKFGRKLPNNRQGLYSNNTLAYDLEIGTRIPLNQNFSIRTGMGFHFITNDNIDDGSFLGENNDFYASIFLGLSFSLPGQKDTDGDGIIDEDDGCYREKEDMDGFEDTDGCPDLDNDKDGILDKNDKCPNNAEDFDNFQDYDGCPDIDNDNDKINDDKDECPFSKEDFDGFEDSDGCPDLDNDADGILDEKDECPNNAEDYDGYADQDGCPDYDNDSDGITDDKDSCPFLAEDIDGFEDNDGCPDEDNDKDGIPDSVDGCPNIAETFNNFQDTDGCPDEKEDRRDITRTEVPKVVPPVIKTDPKETKKDTPETKKVTPKETPKEKKKSEFTTVVLPADEMFKEDEDELISASNQKLDQIAEQIKQSDGKYLIEGHLDKQGPSDLTQKLSYERAKEIMLYLIRKGVSPDKLSIIGHGDQRPVDSNDIPKGRVKNRRMVIKKIN